MRPQQVTSPRPTARLRACRSIGADTNPSDPAIHWTSGTKLDPWFPSSECAPARSGRWHEVNGHDLFEVAAGYAVVGGLTGREMAKRGDNRTRVPLPQAELTPSDAR